LRPLTELTKRITTRAYDSHAAPVYVIFKKLLFPYKNILIFFFKITNIQKLVRFCALFRIKPDAPPLVQTSVNSFEFQPCDFTAQVEYLRVSLYIEKIKSIFENKFKN
jgi:hypothetical protein